MILNLSTKSDAPEELCRWLDGLSDGSRAALAFNVHLRDNVTDHGSKVFAEARTKHVANRVVQSGGKEEWADFLTVVATEQ